MAGRMCVLMRGRQECLETGLLVQGHVQQHCMGKSFSAHPVNLAMLHYKDMAEIYSCIMRSKREQTLYLDMTLGCWDKIKAV